jgi:hypothetical protein
MGYSLGYVGRYVGFAFVKFVFSGVKSDSAVVFRKFN